MKKWNIFFLVILLFGNIFLAGCWDRKEIEQLALVSAILIDKVPEKDLIRVIVQVPNPNVLGGGQGNGGGCGGEKNPVWNFDATGRTLAEAARNLSRLSARNLFFGHTEVVIIGEQLAQEGIKPYLDFFTRNLELRTRIWLVITSESILDISGTPSLIETLPLREIASLITQRQRAVIPQSTLQDYWETVAVAGNGLDLMLPRLRLGESSINIRELDDEFTDTERIGTFLLAGAGLFRDDRLVGWLDIYETRGVLWVQDRNVPLDKEIAVIEAPNGKGKVGINIQSSISRVEAQVEGDEVRMKVQVTVNGDIADYSTSSHEPFTSEEIQSISRRGATLINNEILRALQATQELKVDVFGFGRQLWRQEPEAWLRLADNWDDVFSRLEVDLDVQVTIRGTGLVSNF